MEIESPPSAIESTNPSGSLHTATPKSHSKVFPPANMQSSNSDDQSDTPMELASPPQTTDSQNSSEPLHPTTSNSSAKTIPSDKGGQGILPMETDPDGDQVLSFIASSKKSGPKGVWI